MSQQTPKVGDRIRWLGNSIFESKNSDVGIEGSVKVVMEECRPSRHIPETQIPFQITWDRGRGPDSTSQNATWHWGWAGLPEKRFEIIVVDEWEDELELA